MGLIKAAVGAFTGSMADQWKEFFYCESLPKEVLVTKGRKRINGRSSNTKASDNIITGGSGIAVADGQCMMIVEQGKVVEFCAEPGEYTFDASSEPSIFTGNLDDSLMATFNQMVKRFTYGGDTAKDQRIYYFNTKEVVDNKFGTKNPVPFRVVDRNINLDIDVSLRCSGVYSYRISDPMLFYINVCGNVVDTYYRSELENQLKIEFISALQPAFATLSEKGLRPNEIIAHNTDLEEAMREQLSQKWGEMRGLSVVSVALGSVTLPPEDAELIKQAQRTAMMRDPNMAAATLVDAQSESMRAAAKNSAGAPIGFMGMNMAANAGGMNAADLFAMGQQQKVQAPAAAPAGDTWKCSCGYHASGNFCGQCGSKKPAADGWKCPQCGSNVTGNFCPECGCKKPVDDSWVCSCGNLNKGKFCTACGSKKPEAAPVYRCDKCGYEPADPKNPPKFCPQCGDPFNASDIR